MKRVISVLSRPINFSLVVATAVCVLVYSIGQLALEPTKTNELQKLSILAHKVSQAFLISQQTNEGILRVRVLNRAVDEAARHSHIVSVTVRNAKNVVLASASSSPGDPMLRDHELTYPILNAQGQHLGQIVFEISDLNFESMTTLITRIRLYTLTVFGLVFAICFFLLDRAHPVLPQIINCLRQLGRGNLDPEIPESNNPLYQELILSLKRMIEGLRERDRMRHSLGRIMDPKLADALIKEDPKLGGRRRMTTILFCDIRNYTSICEELSVDELQEFLNEYWKGTVEIIMEQEGTIDKFHGDGVCVVFGAPALHADDPLRAVRTAWRLVGNVAALNERRAAKRKMPIEIGVGIHMGEVIAGHIGSERRMDYTVVGDTVNVAARIEELNKKFGTQILISDQVYEQVEEFVRVKTLTLAHLRGHKRPILIHALKEFHDVTANQSNRAA